jgi:hypothetical protein
MRTHIDVAAHANLSDARAKRADASGGRSNVDVIKKDGDD